MQPKVGPTQGKTKVTLVGTNFGLDGSDHSLTFDGEEVSQVVVINGKDGELVTAYTSNPFPAPLSKPHGDHI